MYTKRLLPSGQYKIFCICCFNICNVQKKPNQTTSAEEQNFQNIAHSCGIASDLIAEKQRRMFLLSDIPDSGTGLIAARSISLGEVVIEEEPLVVVEAEVKNSNISWQVQFWIIF